MPERIAGIKGYVGELLVREWLIQKYFSKDCRILSQMLPENVNSKGGPYLDLCVLKDGKIVAAYEVKAQDYPIYDINKSLKYLWGMEKGINGKYFHHNIDEKAYVDELGESCIISAQIKSFLILMCKPSSDLQNELSGFIKNVKYLKNILKDLEEKVGERKLIEVIDRRFKRDVRLVFKNFDSPKNK